MGSYQLSLTFQASKAPSFQSSTISLSEKSILQPLIGCPFLQTTYYPSTYPFFQNSIISLYYSSVVRTSKPSLIQTFAPSGLFSSLPSFAQSRQSKVSSCQPSSFMSNRRLSTLYPYRNPSFYYNVFYFMKQYLSSHCFSSKKFFS